MNQAFQVAAIQMTSTPDVDQNLEMVRNLMAQAVEQGAQLIALPEYWPHMGDERDKLTIAEHDGQGKMQNAMSSLASQHQIWLVGGTVPIKGQGTDAKVYNACLVYDPAGKRVARYDKIHLFSFNHGKEAYDEARTAMHGKEVTIVNAPFGTVGLSVCYDLRFPELYRAMGTCSLIIVSAAFTSTTGRVHWEVLLRARAIENQCYVLASAQSGKHVNGRYTWGHSMLIDPWGEIKNVLPEETGFVVGAIDLERLQTVRDRLPALKHRTLCH